MIGFTFLSELCHERLDGLGLGIRVYFKWSLGSVDDYSANANEEESNDKAKNRTPYA